MFKFLAVAFVLFCSYASARSLNIQSFNQSSWTNQNNSTITLTPTKTIPTYSAFVLSFSNCKTLCPMMASDLKTIASAVDNIHFYLISIQPDQDSVSDLKKYLQDKKLPEDRFTFIKNSIEQTKSLAQGLDLKFSTKTTAGHIDHSTRLVVFNNHFEKVGTLELDASTISEKVQQLKKLMSH